MLYRVTYQDAASNVGATRQIRHIPDFLRHFVYIVVLLQVKVGYSRRGEADNSDACLAVADLESADDVYHELLNDVPVKILNAAGGVKYEDDVTATAADNCG